MLKYLLLVLFLFWGKLLSCSEIELLKQKLDSISFEQQLETMGALKYDFLVTNNQELIPLYQEYIEQAKPKNYPDHLAKLYELLSLAYYFNGKYDKNFEYGLYAVHLYDSLNNETKLGMIYGELGYQMKRRDLPKAIQLMRTGKAILEKINNLEQLAKIYDNYGILHEMDYRIDSAVYYYNKALGIKKELNDSIGIPYTLCNIFGAFMIQNNPDSALVYLNESVRIRKLTKDRIGLAECFSLYGDYYMSTGKEIEAISFYKKTLVKALEYKYPYLANQMYERISLAYEKLEKPKKALEYFKLFKLYQDSLLNEQTNKTIANLQVKYETAEKEKKIEHQHLKIRSKSMQIFILLVLFALAIAVFILVYLRYKHKQKLVLQQKLNEEKNLRFIEVIETEEKERTRVARELHDGLGQLLSSAKINLSALDETIPGNDKYLLENSLQLIDQSVSEVRTISHNLMPVSLIRYGIVSTLEEIAQKINATGKINVKTGFSGFDKRLTENTERNIYRLVQEIVNNIVKHAEASEIDLQMDINAQNEINIHIVNNGKTFSVEMLKEARGIGWKNIYTRVNMLNGEIEIQPGKVSGTIISIKFKV